MKRSQTTLRLAAASLAATLAGAAVPAEAQLRALPRAPSAPLAPLQAAPLLAAPALPGSPAALQALPAPAPSLRLPSLRTERALQRARVSVGELGRSLRGPVSAEAGRASGDASWALVTGQADRLGQGSVGAPLLRPLPALAAPRRASRAPLRAESESEKDDELIPIDEDAEPADAAQADEAAFKAEVRFLQGFVRSYREQFQRVIVGQKEMGDSILIALLTRGHLLLEGVPGVAKTLAVRTVSEMTSLSFSRIQFTPDLQPFDIMGQEEQDRESGQWKVRRGPIHAHLVLGDEINRAKPRTQSAMLEAMQERQVTVAGSRLPLPDPFFVMATQNPIEQDGTYALPEAQLDRFLLKVVVPLPKEEEIAGIIDLNSGGSTPEVRRILDRDGIVRLQRLVDRIRVSDEIKAYIARLYASTQPGNKYVDLKGRVRAGASPRSAIALAKAAQANAFLEGRTYVIPEDVRAVAHRVLRHRILLSFESEGELNTDQLVTELLQKVPVTLKADAKGK